MILKNELPQRLISSLLIVAFILAGCVFPASDELPTSPFASLSEQSVTSTEATGTAPAPLDEIRNILPEGLVRFNKNNLASLRQVNSLEPFFPPRVLLSPDGSLAASAGLQGVEILEVATGQLISLFPVDIPVCTFGAGAQMAFDPQGKFLALTTLTAIQVWQVGGGKLFEMPVDLRYAAAAQTCGADLPQLALSPRAELLAISGVEITLKSAHKYFMIMNVFSNEPVYEWDGAVESLHGKLTGYTGLGFSPDGTLLQTFDPARFFSLSGQAHLAFRFWSVNDDWQEVERLSRKVERSFPPDQLNFALQRDATLDLLRRTDGKKIASLSGTDCSYAFPCELRLSPQVQKAALLGFTHGTLPYRQGLLAARLQVWDIASQEKVSEITLMVRDLDGVWLADDGKVSAYPAIGSTMLPEATWWTTQTHFGGLLPIEDGQLVFTPLRTSLEEGEACSFCGTCILDVAMLQVSCSEDIRDNTGIPYQKETQADGLVLRSIVQAGSNLVSKVVIPANIPDGWNARVAGFSSRHQTVFYCLDENDRSQGCQVYSAELGKTLANTQDIFSLRFSPSGDLAAYINREQKALNLVVLSNGKHTRVRAYQSRAYAANPLFYSGSDELVYLIENLNNPRLLSLEWLDAPSGKVLRRAALVEAIRAQPSVLALSAHDDFLALGDQSGWVYLLDPEDGHALHAFHAHPDTVIGLAFSLDDRLLITMGSNGIMRWWAVGE